MRGSTLGFSCPENFSSPSLLRLSKPTLAKNSIPEQFRPAVTSNQKWQCFGQMGQENDSLSSLTCHLYPLWGSSNTKGNQQKTKGFFFQSFFVMPTIHPLAMCLMGAHGWMDIKKTLDDKLEMAPSCRVSLRQSAITFGGAYTLPPAAAEQTANITF